VQSTSTHDSGKTARRDEEDVDNVVMETRRNDIVLVSSNDVSDNFETSVNVGKGRTIM